jgi:hypothetical protein
MAAMARPVVVVVDAEDASRQALARELERRYGAHYRIMPSVSPEEALTGLEQLRGEGADVPLVLADQWMPGRTGAQYSHNNSSGLCCARFPPICARRNPASRAISSSGVTVKPYCPLTRSTVHGPHIDFGDHITLAHAAMGGSSLAVPWA